MTLDEILEKLENVRPSGHGFVACCPSHDDREASLGVAEGDDGVLLRCYAGCTTDNVVTALGLTMRDLFPQKSGRVDKDAEPEAIYSYVDESSVELFQAVRFPGKRFRQRHLIDGEWVWNLDGARRVLYRLPQIIAAVQGGRTIYVCEGEKDVHALVAAGYEATCNPMGAGKWRPEYSEFLQGANVIVVADRDEPGRAHAEAVRAALNGVAAAIWIVQAKQGKDAYDHLAAGHAVEDFVLVRQRVRRGIITASEMAEQALEDLLLNEEDVPGFQLVDGVPIVFRQGRMYSLGAYTGDGKTSFAQQGARKLCQEGRRGAYFSLEMPERDLRNRFLMHRGIPLWLLEEPWRLRMDARHYQEYLDGVEELRSWHLDIVFETSMTADKIAEIVADREVEFVVVDHVHRFAWGERRRFEEEVLKLTNVALEQNVMLLLLCQFRKTMRGKDMEAFPRPTIQDFRETSQIADDSSMALAVWRQRDQAGITYTDATQAIILKNRHTTGKHDSAGTVFFPSFDAVRGMFTKLSTEVVAHSVPVVYNAHQSPEKEGDDDHDWLP